MQNHSKKAELLLAAVVIARASSYLVSKLSMRTLPPFNLMALRFLAAFAFLVLLFRKKIPAIRLSSILRGALLGGAFFLVITFELQGLRQTDSSTTSFLENTAIVWVPLMTSVINRKRPALKTFLCALVTLSGVACLTLGGNGFRIGTGEMLCIAASVFYASAIILTSFLSKKEDPLLLGILQVGFIGIFALAAAFLFETPHLPQSRTDWFAILYLAIVCSGFGFTLQPVAQRHVSCERTSLFCALNPLTACILGLLFAHEAMSPARFSGCLLILGGILITNLPSVISKTGSGRASFRTVHGTACKNGSGS